MVSEIESTYPKATVFVAVQMAPHSELSPIGVFSSQQAARAACQECHMLVYGGDLCWMIANPRSLRWIQYDPKKIRMSDLLSYRTNSFEYIEARRLRL